MSSNIEAFWLRSWYQKKWWLYLLLPFEIVFRTLAKIRRLCFEKYFQTTPKIPLIIVGNISMGGTGKTPLLIALVKHLQTAGYKVGVVSRGYGSSAPEYPYLITRLSTVAEAGDEPLSIFQATGCQVCIDANRVAAANYLSNSGCDLLISDDGLQHYRLGRMMEIAVVDAARGFGNGHCFPVGPLRESPARLRSVDFVVANQNAQDDKSLKINTSYNMRLQPLRWYKVHNLERKPLEYIDRGTQVHAVAGIGHPQRFFNTLLSLGLRPECHVYRDHHKFNKDNFKFKQALPIVMTSKDAVKCQGFAEDHWLALEVAAVLDKRFWSDFDVAIHRLVEKRQ